FVGHATERRWQDDLSARAGFLRSLAEALAKLFTEGNRLEHLARLSLDGGLLHDRDGDVGARAAGLLTHVHRLECPRHAAECSLQRIREHAELALVDRGDRV